MCGLHRTKHPSQRVLSHRQFRHNGILHLHSYGTYAVDVAEEQHRDTLNWLVRSLFVGCDSKVCVDNGLDVVAVAVVPRQAPVIGLRHA